ncbi:MAG TPA: cupredoxin domain-containing protein [Myxococcota bacterium]|nr:cupredoxin domain-containing protein [Myxococcota bacterium]
MTERLRRAGPLGRGALAAAAALALSVGASLAADETPHHMMQSSLKEDRDVVQVLSTKVGTKNFYVPGNFVFTAGEGRKISVFNDTDQPHGFEIHGLGVSVVLQPGVETEVPLPKLSPGVYDVGCQLHPAHRHATLVVLPETSMGHMP